MLVEPDYKGFRICITAFRSDDAGWNAEMRVSRVLSEETPHTEVVMCRKLTRQMAEERALVYAQRWVDRHVDR